MTQTNTVLVLPTYVYLAMVQDHETGSAWPDGIYTTRELAAACDRAKKVDGVGWSHWVSQMKLRSEP